MKKLTMVLVALAAVMLIAPSAFAQDEARAVGGGRGLMAIAAGFGMALAAFGSGGVAAQSARAAATARAGFFGEEQARRGKAGFTAACAACHAMDAKPGAMRPLVAHCHAGLATIHTLLGDHVAAGEHRATALEICQTIGMQAPPELAQREVSSASAR